MELNIQTLLIVASVLAVLVVIIRISIVRKKNSDNTISDVRGSVNIGDKN